MNDDLKERALVVRSLLPMGWKKTSVGDVFHKHAIDSGMLRKEDLIDGCAYDGIIYDGNEVTAVWDGVSNLFSFSTIVVFTTKEELAIHPDDDGINDLTFFYPMQKVTVNNG